MSSNKIWCYFRLQRSPSLSWARQELQWNLETSINLLLCIDSISYSQYTKHKLLVLYCQYRHCYWLYEQNMKLYQSNIWNQANGFRSVVYWLVCSHKIFFWENHLQCLCFLLFGFVFIIDKTQTNCDTTNELMQLSTVSVQPERKLIQAIRRDVVAFANKFGVRAA